jgi:hypothetical protein
MLLGSAGSATPRARLRTLDEAQFATTSSALALVFAGLPLFGFDETPAGELDLALLAPVARIGCFVVTVQEQYDFGPVGVAKDMEQNLLTLACLATS